MPKKLIKTHDGEEEWHDGLFSCFDSCEILIMGLCCPCIRWGKTLEKAKLWDFTHAAGIMAVFLLLPGIVAQIVRNLNGGLREPGSPGEIGISVLTTVCELAVGFLLFKYRRQIVKKYNIDEGECCTLMSVLFCSSCAICQEARHVEDAEE